MAAGLGTTGKLIDSIGLATPLPRGGSPVKVYALTPGGQDELRAQRERYERFSAAVRGVIGGPA